MNLNDAYISYAQHPNETTLTDLFRAITYYATRLASMHMEYPDRDDSAQDAVVYVWRHLSKFDPNRGKFQQWCLAKILASFSSYRRAKYAQKRGGAWHFVSLFPDDVDAIHRT